MRRNRKISKKMSVVATNTMRIGSIVVFAAVMVILNLLASTTCNQLLKTKGDLERELANCESERIRAAAQWEEMTTPEQINVALWRHRLVMTVPKPEQNVQMKPDGTPYPGQLSLRRLKGSETGAMAANAGRPSPYRRRGRQ